MSTSGNGPSDLHIRQQSEVLILKEDLIGNGKDLSLNKKKSLDDLSMDLSKRHRKGINNDYKKRRIKLLKQSVYNDISDTIITNTNTNTNINTIHSSRTGDKTPLLIRSMSSYYRPPKKYHATENTNSPNPLVIYPFLPLNKSDPENSPSMVAVSVHKSPLFKNNSIHHNPDHTIYTQDMLTTNTNTTNTNNVTPVGQNENKFQGLKAQSFNEKGDGLIPKMQHLTHKCQILCACVGGIPTEFAWSLGESIIIPYLLSLGSPYWLISYVFILTPPFDSFLQPFYGRCSDRLTQTRDACCGLGGRKPLMLLFGAIATVGFLITPFAREIIRTLFFHGEVEDNNNSFKYSCIFLAMLGYTLVDMSHGHLLIPAKAIVNDIAESEEEVNAGAMYYSIFQCLGRVIGYSVIIIDWKAIFSNLHMSDFAFLFCIACIPLWFCILVVSFAAPSQSERLVRSGEFRFLSQNVHQSPLSLDFVPNLPPDGNDDTEKDETVERNTLLSNQKGKTAIMISSFGKASMANKTDNVQQQRPSLLANTRPSIRLLEVPLMYRGRIDLFQYKKTVDDLEDMTTATEFSDVTSHMPKSKFKKNKRKLKKRSFEKMTHLECENEDDDDDDDEEANNGLLTKRKKMVLHKCGEQSDNEYDEEYEEDESDDDDYIKPYDELPYSEGDDYEKKSLSITPPDLFGDTKHSPSSKVDVSPLLNHSGANVAFSNHKDVDPNEIHLEDTSMTDPGTPQIRFVDSKITESENENRQKSIYDSENMNEQEYSSGVSIVTKKSANTKEKRGNHGTKEKRGNHATKHRRYVSRYRWKPKRLKYGVQRKKQMESRKKSTLDQHDHSKYKEYKKKYKELSAWKFPNLFKVYWCIQWLGWLQVNVQSLFITSYGGFSIFKGDPSAPPSSPEYKAFMSGVRFVTIGLVLQGVVSMIFSSLLPYVNSYFGTMRVFVTGELSMCLCGVLLFLTQDDPSGMRLFGLLAVYGIFLQIHYNNCWILVERELRALKHEDERGYVVGVFNLSLTYSVILVSLFGGPILNLFQGSFLAAIIAWSAGAGVGMLIAYVFLYIECKKREKRREEKRNLKWLIKTRKLEHLIEKLEKKQTKNTQKEQRRKLFQKTEKLDSVADSRFRISGEEDNTKE